MPRLWGGYDKTHQTLLCQVCTIISLAINIMLINVVVLHQECNYNILLVWNYKYEMDSIA